MHPSVAALEHGLENLENCSGNLLQGIHSVRSYITLSRGVCLHRCQEWPSDAFSCPCCAFHVLDISDTCFINTVSHFPGYPFARLTVPSAIQELLTSMYSTGLFLPLILLLWGLYPQFNVSELSVPVFVLLPQIHHDLLSSVFRGNTYSGLPTFLGMLCHHCHVPISLRDLRAKPSSPEFSVSFAHG